MHELLEDKTALHIPRLMQLQHAPDPGWKNEGYIAERRA